MLSVGADVIPNGINITKLNMTFVKLSWEPPESPNGRIRSYNIEYKRVDVAVRSC